MHSHVWTMTTATALMLVASVAAAASSATLETKYPEASDAFAVVKQSPLLEQALVDDAFFDRLDTDEAFLSEIEGKLGESAYRHIVPTPSLRVRVFRGTTYEYPSILLEFQTQHEWTSFDGWGKPGDSCVLVRGGRDSYQQRTFFGGCEDPELRKQLVRMLNDRKDYPSNKRKEEYDPKTREFMRKHLPNKDLAEVRANIMGVLDNLVKAFAPYGAAVLDGPQGHYGVKLTDRLYIHLRDFPLQREEGETTNLRYSHDPFIWLTISGGPKELPKCVPAFPGAEGPGAVTTGGRGGRAIYVTNLNPSGPGSLAEALASKGPRIVLFKVSGQIFLPDEPLPNPAGAVAENKSGNIELDNSPWIVEPDLTLIGYTAPGEGVEVWGRLCMAASNAIVRGVRFRLRPPLMKDGMDTSGNLDRVIFDHCSFAYGSDELLRFIGEDATLYRYTIQYCLLGPGLAGLGNHPYGPEIGGDGMIHHNILFDTASRSPEVDCMQIDWRNNLMYNLRSGHSCRPWSKFNMIGNYIVDRAGSERGYSFDATDNVWAENNLRESGGQVMPFEIRKSDYLKKAYPSMPVAMHDPKKLEEVLTPIVGACIPVRDATDKHFLEGLKSREGKIPYYTDESGELTRARRYETIEQRPDLYERWKSEDYPPPAAGVAAPDDSDNDGMPDEWETANGLDPKNAADGAQDADKDGYTNVEEFLYRTNPNEFVDYTDPKNNVHTLHGAI
ncbi:hypothetical protein JW916_13070 [Candidatus Sumerlaeota bacterium]|nr:hypothetical protein [Candidatus Sumerlaeota bacterium]